MDTLAVLQGTLPVILLQIEPFEVAEGPLRLNKSCRGSFVGAGLEMPVRVLEADEKVEQMDRVQFFNPAAVVPMSE